MLTEAKSRMSCCALQISLLDLSGICNQNLLIRSKAHMSGKCSTQGRRFW
jgi:hypothetical protein